jgi:tetratricopeptide (TPR) repeat protein
LNRSVTIKAAYITGVAIVLGASITALFYFFGGDRKSKQSQVVTTGDVQAPISMLQETGPVTIHYNIPATVTKEAIQQLEKKLEATDEKIGLTRGEIELLASALKDLDQRTSGIEKLPDGRTKLGHFVSGHPSIVIQEHEEAVHYFRDRDYEHALERSQNAINAYEDTKKVKYSLSTGDLEPQAIGTIYRLAAMSAQRFSRSQLAHNYAEKAANAHSSSANKALLSTTFANLHRFDEALKWITEALNDDPKNVEYTRLRDDYKARIPR